MKLKTINDLQRVVDKFDAPGWKITIQREGLQAWVHVNMATPPMNSNKPNEQLVVYGEPFPVTPGMTAMDVVCKIYTAIQFRIIHELAENVKFGGIRIFNHHNEPADIKRIRDLIMDKEVLI